MESITFSNKYVAFLDVLGFKELVFKDNQSKLNEYFETVHQAIKVVENDKEKLSVFQISDSIILIADNDTEQFKLLLRAIQTIQISLLSKNMWIRGAVTKGNVYFNKTTNIIVGKALTKAYLLEQEAKLPYVIIDPEILKLLQLNKSKFIDKLNGSAYNLEEHNDKLIHDNYTTIQEDSIFVSFMNRVLYEHYNSDKHSLANIYKDLIENLYSEQKHYSKYLWLKKYFLNTLLEYKETLNYMKSQFNNDMGLKEIEIMIEKFESA